MGKAGLACAPFPGLRLLVGLRRVRAINQSPLPCYTTGQCRRGLKPGAKRLEKTMSIGPG